MNYSKPLVIDIYHGDPIINIQPIKDFGIIGVIHKATQGTTIKDDAYNLRRHMFDGMLWGAYHFFHGDGKAEADFFLSVAQPDKNTLVCLDWENVGGGSPTANQARAFLERIEEKLGRKAVIYSGNVAKERIVGKDVYFSTHKLWLCQYGLKWKVQQSWQYPWLWQNNGDAFGPGPHNIPGIKDNCDNNCIVEPMTAERLKNEWAS